MSDPFASDLDNKFRIALGGAQRNTSRAAPSGPRENADGGDRSPARALPEIIASSFEGKPVPPREWLVKDYIPAQVVSLFAGDGGTGKTLIGLQLCVAVVAQARWLGLDVQSTRALFFAAEDEANELHRRLTEIVESGGLSWQQLAGLKLVTIADQDAELGRAEGRASVRATDLFGAVERAARKVWRRRCTTARTRSAPRANSCGCWTCTQRRAAAWRQAIGAKQCCEGVQR